MSGGKPRPRNDRVDSAMIAAATSIVPATITGPSAFGRMWRTTRRKVEAPRARAASTNSFSRSAKNCARTRRATVIQRKAPIPATIRMKMPSSGPSTRSQRIAEQIDEQQQHRQLRQRQEQIDQPHQRGVDAAARYAGERTDNGADDDRDGHRRQTDRERDASAIQHARQQVLAEIVGTQRMCPARPLQLRGEIDVVDLHAPYQRTERHRQDHRQQHHGARHREAMAAKAPPGLGPGRDVPRPRLAQRRSRSRGVNGRRCVGRASHTAGPRSG